MAVTYLLVQFFKDPVKQHLSDWWIRLLTVGFALTILVFTLYVTGNFTVEAIGLAVLNSFMVAITAAGAPYHRKSDMDRRRAMKVLTLFTVGPFYFTGQVSPYFAGKI